MAQVSKMVTVQINYAKELIVAINTHKKRIAQKSVDVLTPNPSSKKPIQAEHIINLLDGMIHHLQDVTEQMSESDLHHTRESLETKQARSERNQTFQKVTDGYTSLKYALMAAYGPKVLEHFALNEKNPRTPIDMLRKFNSIIDIIDEGKIQLPKPFSAEFPAWTLKNIRNFVAPMAKELEAALTHVSKEVQEDKGSLTNKWKLMEEQHTVYASLASISESLAAMVGDKELAKRLRPRSPATRPGHKLQEDKAHSNDTPIETPNTPSELTP
ncbi:MAG: hypothetical protein CL920_00970 [Deltaproteobacteria bacterium]|nr:hypothetical protein [Deltaproteobacteria bacterium]